MNRRQFIAGALAAPVAAKVTQEASPGSRIAMAHHPVTGTLWAVEEFADGSIIGLMPAMTWAQTCFALGWSGERLLALCRATRCL